jgi:RNA polymerase sigma-70 factor, ECF subfamily
VMAEVFLIAWRRFDGVPQDALPWLLGVARRVLANQRRGDSRVAALRDRIREEHAEAKRSGEGGGVISPAMRALWSLSDSDQELLMLIAWDGLTRAEVAAALGLSTGAVAVRLHRARRRLAAARAATTRTARVGGSSEMEVTR